MREVGSKDADAATEAHKTGTVAIWTATCVTTCEWIRSEVLLPYCHERMDV